jgi:amino acid transporter
MSGADPKAGERDLDRELIELLNELRVALPGVQVLFAFLLILPFSSGWDEVDGVQRGVYFVSFLTAAVASALLIAPSAIHRLRWREQDKEHLLQVSNRLAIAGTAFLAAGMCSAVFVIGDVLFGPWWAALVAGLLALVFAWFWYGLALVRRAARGDARASVR